MQTNNHDVRALHSELNRYIEEVQKSQSANLAQIREADMARFRSYLARYNDILDWIVAQPQLDLPESHPDVYELEEYPELAKLENEVLNSFSTLLDLARKENANSASSRAPSGLLPQDANRQRGYRAKMIALLDMSTRITPADFPESSPRAASITDGRTGIDVG